MEVVKKLLGEEAAIVIGVIVAIVNSVITVAGLGSFDDGLQWEDIIAILSPVVGAGLIRQQVFSQKTVTDIVNQQELTTMKRSQGEPSRRKPTRR